LLIPNQPLSLDLYYLITAYDADNSYVHEQQVMSIVLKCFHENPIMTTTVPFPPPQPAVQEEFTLTMEIETSDDAARLWQAITVPYRLSVFYKVTVVFVSPPAPPTASKPAVRFSLAVDPAAFPYARSGQVIGTSSTATFTSPNSTAAHPEIVSFDYSPALVTPSPAVITQSQPKQRVFLYGAGLNQGANYAGPPPNPGTSYRVYLLLPPDYTTEQEVTAWKALAFDASPPIQTDQTDSRIILDIPSAVGAIPANAPRPGIYQLRAGSDPPADLAKNRTNATPFSIAARVDVSAVPPSAPILNPTGLRYTIRGMGFIATQTEVLLETIPLQEVLAPTPPVAGQFSVSDIGTIIFQRPDNMAPGLYAVRIRANQVESPPGWWIRV
jgi:hypothetical protein